MHAFRAIYRYTLHVAVGKRLPGPPSKWPALDGTYCWLEGSRCTSFVSTILGLDLFVASVVPMIGSN